MNLMYSNDDDEIGLRSRHRNK